MPRTPRSRGRPGPRTPNAIEWTGGVRTLPGVVTDEDEPFRPEVLVWMDAGGLILGSTVLHPRELHEQAPESLRDTMENPKVGRPHVPDRVRVASPELAAALRAGHPGLEIVQAPTPELDEVFEAMLAHVGAEDARRQSDLPSEVDAEAVGAFFRATAGLFRSRPWEVVPNDTDLVSVTIEALGLREAALSVIGQLGQNLGLVLFAGVNDFEAYVDAVGEMEAGGMPPIPAHMALSYERGADVDPGLRKAIAQHAWEVAGAEAHPRVMVFDTDPVSRPPTGRELAVFEALALALPQVLSEPEALLAAWEGRAPVSRTVSVASSQGPLEVSLRVPHPQLEEALRLPENVLEALRELVDRGEGFEAEDREPLEAELLRRFRASPEAEGLPELWACAAVMDFAGDHLGDTIATLRPAGLREILYELIPRKMGMEASEAGEFAEELRAFYAFLKREFGLEQAEGCRRVLGPVGLGKFEDALSDTSKFGMAKSVILAGREAGFDIDSPEGLEAWMRGVQGKPLPPSVRWPSPETPARRSQSKAERERKKKRKAARKARKKNR